MKRSKSFRAYLRQQLKDRTVKASYEREGVFVELAIQIARLRAQHGLSQSELARRLHTTQQTVSRLESSHNTSLSVQTLVKLARVLDKRLKVQFV